MSQWTNVIAVIDVDTHMEKVNIKEIVEEKLRNAPKITGSEGPAGIYTNVVHGHNVWTSADCGRCKYKDTITTLDKGFTCGKDNNFTCPEGEYQTRVIISILGDLRDKNIKDTEKEYNQFLDYIENTCGFWIRNKAVNII